MSAQWEVLELLECRIFRMFHDDGTVTEGDMTEEWARRFIAMDEAEQRRERRYRQHTSTFSKKGKNPNSVQEHEIKRRLARKEYKGHPHEPPRYLFTHLIGASRIWWGARLDDIIPELATVLVQDPNNQWASCWRPGPADPCECCAGIEMEEHMYCLRCTRSGQDHRKNMRPSKADLALRAPKIAPKTEADGLSGGKGKAKGRKPKPEPAQPGKGRGKGRGKAKKKPLKGGLA